MLASQVLMVAPAAFRANSATSADNHFQNLQVQVPTEHAQAAALAEFEALERLLERHVIMVTRFDDNAADDTPDSIFPNNWFATGPGCGLSLFPMMAENRRMERKQLIINWLQKRFPLQSDLTRFEKENRFLEGTGSMVIDWDHKTAYACISPRTDLELFEGWCADMDLAAVAFHATDAGNNPYYHTNVMMAFGPDYTLACLESIHESQAIEYLTAARDRIIPISRAQVESFCGNVLCLQNIFGHPFTIMSTSAFNALTDGQKEAISVSTQILHTPLPTIEALGGGSARCMLAELWMGA
jgi:hypothetical protein